MTNLIINYLILSNGAEANSIDSEINDHINSSLEHIITLKNYA